MPTSPVQPIDSPTPVPTDALEQPTNTPEQSSSRVDITEKRPWLRAPVPPSSPCSSS